MNRVTRVIVATLGVMFAIAGMSHGFFETLQGNTPTGGMIIDAIGVAQRTWTYGGEGAFTLIPNFLVTGLAAISVSLVILVWSVGFVQTRHGATVFLLLLILLSLVGGGIAQIAFFTVVWAFATRINKPLTWWRKVLPEGVRSVVAGLWPWLLTLGSLLFLLSLEIAIFGFFPGVTDATQLLTIIFISLGIGLGLFVLTFVAGFAHDIQQQTDSYALPSLSV